MQDCLACRSLTSPQEFEELVQRNMAVNCSINFQGLAEFLATIAVRQLRRLGTSAAYSSDVLEEFSLQRCTLAQESLARALLDSQSATELYCNGRARQQLVCFPELEASRYLPSSTYEVGEELLHNLEKAEGPAALCAVIQHLVDVCKRCLKEALERRIPGSEATTG